MSYCSEGQDNRRKRNSRQPGERNGDERLLVIFGAVEKQPVVDDPGRWVVQTEGEEERETEKEKEKEEEEGNAMAEAACVKNDSGSKYGKYQRLHLHLHLHLQLQVQRFGWRDGPGRGAER